MGRPTPSLPWKARAVVMSASAPDVRETLGIADIRVSDGRGDGTQTGPTSQRQRGAFGRALSLHTRGAAGVARCSGGGPGRERRVCRPRVCGSRPARVAASGPAGSLLRRPRVARPMGPQEVGGVGDADRLLAAVLDRLVRAYRREGLDHGGVQAAVNDAPRLVVAFVGGDRPGDARGRGVVEARGEQLQQLARLDVDGHHQCRVRCAGGACRCRAGAHRHEAELAVGALELVQDRRQQARARPAEGWPSARAPPLTLTRSMSARARAARRTRPTRTPR
jgi:hypothetical protein